MNDTIIPKVVFDFFPMDRRDFYCPRNIERRTAMTAEQTWNGKSSAAADVMILVEHNNNIIIHMKGTPQRYQM